MTDIFEEKLLMASKELAECQRSHGFIKTYNETEYLSCNDCEKLIGCQIRLAYVDSVYASMSKGVTGGFEF